VGLGNGRLPEVKGSGEDVVPTMERRSHVRSDKLALGV